MKNKPIVGVILALTSALVYAAQTAVVKSIGGEISIPVIVFVQSIICFVLIIPLFLAQGSQQAIRLIQTRHRKTYFFRTIFSLGISYFLFYALKSVPLVDAVLLTNTAPLLIPLIGWLFMSQKFNHHLWLPLFIGFIGVALVLKPDGDVFQLTALLALAAGVCMASSVLLIGKASKDDNSFTNAFYYFLFSLPISAIGAALFWTPLPLHGLLILIGVGTLFFAVQMTLILALKFVSAQIVGSLYLFNIVFAAIIGVIIWHTTLTIAMVLGIILTMAGAVMTIQAQNKQKQLPPLRAATNE